MSNIVKRVNFRISRDGLSIHVSVLRALEDGAPLTKIRLSYNNISKLFRSFDRFFDYVEKVFGKRILRAIDDVLDSSDLCIRCGLCCVSGAPCITVNDSRLMYSSEYGSMICKRLSDISGIEVSDSIMLFLSWNASLRLMKPCPFLNYDRSIAVCEIYPVRPSFCRIFKCWTSLSDIRRKEHLRLVLSQLRSCNVGHGLEKLKEIATSNIESMYSYLF